MNDMLRRFRRGSKDTTEAGPSCLNRCDVCSAHENAAEKDAATNEGKTPRMNFFDLPAELRNAIYEFVISDTTLYLSTSFFAASKKGKLPLKKRKAIPTPINGLLLASRQCRLEYLSVLLSSVSVVVEVKDFNFENVMRVSASLDELETKALQSNRNLTISLITQNCTTKDTMGLKRWLDHRSRNLDSYLPWKYKNCDANLPWKYEFPLQRMLPPTPMGRVCLLREVEYYADTIAKLASDVDETQQSELKSIIQAFMKASAWLQDDLGTLGQRSKNVSRNLRGLAGGGVH